MARWPLGIALTCWRYMWRTTPMRRHETEGSAARDWPPAIPPGVSRKDVQLPQEGVGPLFHRRYRTRIVSPKLTAEELMGRIREDPNRVAPTEFARFHKLRGAGGHMNAGDEFLVHMPGPWDGPVRVVDVSPSSFRFATLSGHLEAGQIEFRGDNDEGVILSIESWARSGDRLSHLLFDRLRMAKEVQLHMWTSFLEQAARLAGGRLAGGITIETRRVEAALDEKRASG
ncbi:MAG TPA: DUF1990 family protein [Actinomycetota bacterium]|nr:DUF1990 family protein [Actinomycetota bacterium]